MSIIQEALKKVQKGSAEKILSRREIESSPVPVNGKSGREKTKSRLLPYFVVAVFIVTAIFMWGSRPSATQTAAAAKDDAPVQARKDVSKEPSPAKSGTASYTNKTALTLPFALSAEAPQFVLSGVMQLVDGPRAIVNNVIVGVGDAVDGATVENIDKDGVTLKSRDRQIKLGMK